MNKIFIKSVFLVIPLLFAFTSLIAQTITIGSIDTGPYGSGSTIAVPFTVNDASGCITQNNIYSLYLCDASGNPIPGAPVDTIKNFYGTAFNFTVPVGTPAGTYTFIVKSSSPAVSSSASSPFTISATAGGTAAATCPSTQIADPTYPTVYGTCSGSNGMQYTFTNASSSGSTVTATFFNEFTQTIEASNVSLNPNYTFTANAANYIVTVKSVSASGIVSTYSYQLVNNVVNSNFGSTGNSTACLVSGFAQLTYTIDITSANGIQHNYPGNLYTISWGDGTPNGVYTLCQIEALNGQISHNYTKISCGYSAGATNNAFPVNFLTNNNFCGKIGTVVSDVAEIYNVPQNSFTGPSVACTGTPVSFINTSTPGPCSSNSTALYNWSVDGIIIAYSYKITKNFVPTLTEGNHTIALHLVNPVNGLNCLPSDYSQTICVQDPPKPNFIIAQKTMCIGDGPIIPTNTSVIDSSCNKQYSYTWTVKPSTGVTYNAGAIQPSIAFTSPGIYTVGLAITTASCGKITAPTVDTIVVNATPVATLSGDFSTCGNNQTLSFDSVTTRPTYTILSGTAQPQANTYTWSVTGGAFSYAAGYTLHSKYPHIIFNDYTTYTVTVTQQNNCGLTTSVPQHITFQQAPTVDAGNDTTICAGTSAFLKGKITGNGLVSYKWIGGGGTYTPNANSLNTTYTPSAAEISAGHVTLTLQATTSIAAPCNLINNSVIITIIPTGKITSPLTKAICSNQRINYQITSNNTPSTYTWTAQLISGSASGFSASGISSKITDSLINTDPTASINAVVAYTITPISSTGCAGTPSILNVTVAPLPILTATIANPAICSNQPANITLTTKLSGVSYTWTSTAPANISGNTNQATAVNTAEIKDLLINNGSSPANVTYTITPFSASGCQGTPITAVITVQPLPVTAYAGPDQTVCGINTYTLQGNSPGFGHGKWTIVTGSGVNITNDTIPNTTVNGLIGGNIYQFEWTITTSPTCQSQNTVSITVNSATVPGVTSSANPTTVCANSNGGLISLTGQVGKVLHWQKSIDNGVTFQTVIPIDSTSSLVYNNLTQTTEYQAVVQNASCDILTSTPITITVNQPAPTSIAGKDTTLCSAASYQLNGNNPGTFAASWRQIAGPPVTFADSTNYRTVVNGLKGGVYTFIWIIKGASPCSDSQSQVNITDNADVIASFTNGAINSCGSQTVTFTNTSNNQSGASFLWNFGDGTTSTAASPQHFFKETTNGTDTAYVVSLSVLSNCKQRPPVYDTIHITSDKVIAAILPLQTTGCAPFTLDIQNVSPGNNVSYKFYLYNGNALVQELDKTDKTDAIFTPINVNAPTQYTVYMTTVGLCGTTATTNKIPIAVSPPTVTPQMYILNNMSSGCAPLNVSFVNNSSGGSSYHYNIYDANGNLIEQPIAGTANLPYIFTATGSYSVSITAANNCSPQGIESAKIAITVYPVPQPTFAASIDCAATVSFLNTTTQNGTTPSGSLSYSWNFGDGSASDYGFTPKPHYYNFKKSPFTVTLTATNTVTGCADSTKQTVNINAPLIAQFKEQPDSVITIPNYEFSFIDESTGPPSSWAWNFGDGTTSTVHNPEHRYSDTGYYQVRLIISNNGSCTSSVTHIVRVTGTPGQLFLPNAFMPTGSAYDLRLFMAKGSGIKTWELQIFNNYGQLLWETNKLDSKGSPVEGWDGTFRGVLMQQGAYIWQASATFINGSVWKGMSYNNSPLKRTGTVNLIR
ncbi:MAG: PKD domain-containing protein [Sphingobacteriales bacterium]